MPTKIQTETQLLRLLGNTPLQVEITLIRTASYESKNTQKEHLGSFYTTFDQVKDKKFDDEISIIDYQTDLFFKPTNLLEILKEYVPKIKQKIEKLKLKQAISKGVKENSNINAPLK